ncbi:MAG: hypothetical protein WCY93_10535 [Anaerolineaceae bacterium]
MDTLKELIDDEGLFKAISEAETDTEKQLIMLALIRNNTKSIKAWVTLFGILCLIGIVLSLFIYTL